MDVLGKLPAARDGAEESIRPCRQGGSVALFRAPARGLRKGCRIRLSVHSTGRGVMMVDLAGARMGRHSPV